MNWYKKSQKSNNIFYHGTPLDFNSFDYSYMDKNRFETGADQYGPGFYFTDKLQLAKSYALDGFIWELQNPPTSSLLSPNQGMESINDEVYKNMIKSSGKVLQYAQDMGMTDLGEIEGYEDGEVMDETQLETLGGDYTIDQILNSMKSYTENESAIEVFHNIWNELYKDSSGDWVRNMAKNGINGSIYTLGGGVRFLILYNNEIANMSEKNNVAHYE